MDSMTTVSIEKPFALQEQRRDDLTILSAGGPIEMIELGALERALKRLAREGRRRVIVDFSEVTTLSTLAVAGFVICAESFRSIGGEMTVTGVSRALRDAFRMIDSEGRLKQQTDVVTAIKAMSPQTAETEG
jgi:anti-anti-sigma regulatory factor